MLNKKVRYQIKISHFLHANYQVIWRVTAEYSKSEKHETKRPI